MTTIEDEALRELMGMARIAAQQSYSPYSGFRVGAALRLANGEVVSGTNVENVSYGLTICAERAALAAAIARFGPTTRVTAVAIANLNNAPSPPCGACRQVLAEFIDAGAPVAFPLAGEMRVLSFAEIMPLAFEMKRQ